MGCGVGVEGGSGSHVQVSQRALGLLVPLTTTLSNQKQDDFPALEVSPSASPKSPLESRLQIDSAFTMPAPAHCLATLKSHPAG